MKNREYLNDYKLDDNNKYVYTGKYYTYVDSEDLKLNKSTFVFLSVVVAIAVLSGGFINTSGMNNTFYVILPFITEVICTFVLCWNVIRLISQGNSIKEYVYISVTKKIPTSAKALLVFSSISFVATTVCCIIDFGIDLISMIYPMLKIVTIFVTVLFIKVYNTISFEQKN